MKKLLTIILSAVMTIGMCFSFVGCKKKGPIPDGCYFATKDESRYVLIGEENKDGCCWIVEGDYAEFWVSSCLEFKCNILIENDGIYFKGYEWIDVLSTILRGEKYLEGKVFKCRVIYDENEQSITFCSNIYQL